MRKAMTLMIMLTAAVTATGTLASTADEKAAAPAAAEQAASKIQIQGGVKQTAGAITLFDGKKTYLLKGEQDLSPFAGKIVDVTGEVRRNESGTVILVKRIAESQ